MSVFGGAASAAALSVSEALHGNIVSVQQGDGITRPHRVTVRLSSSGVEIKGVIYAGKMGAGASRELVSASVNVTKAGGRWIILN